METTAPTQDCVPAGVRCAECAHWTKNGRATGLRLCRHPDALLNSAKHKQCGAELVMHTGRNFSCARHELATGAPGLLICDDPVTSADDDPCETCVNYRHDDTGKFYCAGGWPTTKLARCLHRVSPVQAAEAEGEVVDILKSAPPSVHDPKTTPAHGTIQRRHCTQ